MNIGSVRNWISSVPAISRHTGVNQEDYRVTVQPYDYGKQNAVKNTNSGFHFVVKDHSTAVEPLKTLVSSDNLYTKEDAVMAQWNKQGSFNLFDVIEGKAQVPLQNPNPSAEELKELEEMLQKNGISKEIDWSNLKFDFQGMGFQENDFGNTVSTLQNNRFERKTEYITSRYAAVCYKINQYSTGEQKQNQMDKLNQIYQSALEEIAKGYSSIVGDFLEETGIKGEKEKIYQSVIEGAKNRVAEYQNYLEKNNDFLALSGTKDAWLLDDDEYIAARLREQNISETASQTQQSAQYSLKDLAVLGEYVSSVSKMEEGTSYKMDEERLGIDFAMLSMKTDTLRKQGCISKNFDDLLSKLEKEYVNHFLDTVDKTLEQQRKANIVYDSTKGFQKLDRKSVWNVYHKTMQIYHNTGDAIKALIGGAEFGLEQRNNHYYDRGATYRYRNSSDYWSCFFVNENKDGTKIQNYKQNSSTYQKYFISWKDFESSLKNGNAIKLNTDLKSDINDICYVTKQI